jgi:protein-S-isoprenylcysteine O-methyltransferase Ste14
MIAMVVDIGTFNALLLALVALAVVTAALLLLVAAPYGRHVRRGWGPTVGNRLGWILMEAPAPLLFALLFVRGEYREGLTSWVFLFMWQAHYLHRAFVYPLSLRGEDKQMPLIIAALGFVFNAMNAYLNGLYLFTLSGGYSAQWLADPRFLAGLALFATGYLINRQADRTLRSLRSESESLYAIPHGGLYRWISCPNYFGEIVEWVGWAIATWSPAALAFAVWTAANLAPRARSHHHWYRERFDDYPPDRKALMPRLW